MIKRLVLLCLMAVSLSASAMGHSAMRRYPGGRCFMVRLYLKDKADCGYSLDHPEAFLSAKALARRQRQHLAVDSTDLPIPMRYLSRIESRSTHIVAQSKWNNTVLCKGSSLEKLMELAQLPFVDSVKKVFTSPDSIRRQVRDSYRDEFQYWDSIPGEYYGQGKAQIASLNGITLHRHGYRGNGMTIAVIDAGFMNVDRIPAFTHVNIIGTRNFVNNPQDDVYKQIDHGTKVLSTMAVNMPEIFVGTAPDASYWLLRSEDYDTESSAEEDYWAAAAEFADSVGVDVISSSLGYVSFDDKTTDYSYADLNGTTAQISRTASMLSRKGIVLVNSAGNEGMATWKKIGFPADARRIITVGAVSPDSVNASFSSLGPTADGRVKPDVMAYGCPASVVTGHGTITQDMGTSFAAPIIAGMVACLWQSLPSLTASDIISLVRQSGSISRQPNNVMGYGIPDFWKAHQMGRQYQATDNSRKADNDKTE